MTNNKNTKSNDYFLGKDVVLKKLLQNTAALRNYNEVFHPERTSRDKALKELVEEICNNQRIWLLPDEIDKLSKNGSIEKRYRLGNLDGFLLELVIQDISEEMLETPDFENNRRYFISMDMIKSYQLVEDDVFTIHVKG
jgi:hypothetical protein